MSETKTTGTRRVVRPRRPSKHLAADEVKPKRAQSARQVRRREKGATPAPAGALAADTSASSMQSALHGQQQQQGGPTLRELEPFSKQWNPRDQLLAPSASRRSGGSGSSHPSPRPDDSGRIGGFRRSGRAGGTAQDSASRSPVRSSSEVEVHALVRSSAESVTPRPVERASPTSARAKRQVQTDVGHAAADILSQREGQKRGGAAPQEEEESLMLDALSLEAMERNLDGVGPKGFVRDNVFLDADYEEGYVRKAVASLNDIHARLLAAGD